MRGGNKTLPGCAVVCREIKSSKRCKKKVGIFKSDHFDIIHSAQKFYFAVSHFLRECDICKYICREKYMYSPVGYFLFNKKCDSAVQCYHNLSLQLMVCSLFGLVRWFKIIQSIYIILHILIHLNFLKNEVRSTRQFYFVKDKPFFLLLMCTRCIKLMSFIYIFDIRNHVFFIMFAFFLFFCFFFFILAPLPPL